MLLYSFQEGKLGTPKMIMKGLPQQSTTGQVKTPPTKDRIESSFRTKAADNTDQSKSFGFKVDSLRSQEQNFTSHPKEINKWKFLVHKKGTTVKRLCVIFNSVSYLTISMFVSIF